MNSQVSQYVQLLHVLHSLKCGENGANQSLSPSARDREALMFLCILTMWMQWRGALRSRLHHNTLEHRGARIKKILGKPMLFVLSLEQLKRHKLSFMPNQLPIYGKTRGLPELASLFRRSWVCWVMDIIYLANSENTYYINLFNLTIALVYLIEKSPQLEKLKPCLTTGAPAAKWLSRLAPVRHSIVAGP